MKKRMLRFGGLPYLLANIVSLLIRPYAGDISTGMAFSFASFFLFLAVIPLMYAPETLPEKVMKDRDLKSYIEKALNKRKRRVEKKPRKRQSEKRNNNDQEERQESPEDEEARKLAEKYY